MLVKIEVTDILDKLSTNDLLEVIKSQRYRFDEHDEREISRFYMYSGNSISDEDIHFVTESFEFLKDSYDKTTALKAMLAIMPMETKLELLTDLKSEYDTCELIAALTETLSQDEFKNLFWDLVTC
jgi:hypothetical protein